MNKSYQTLFSVHFHHDYYNSGLLKKADFIPSDITFADLKRNGLIFKRFKNGFKVLGAVNASGEPFIELGGDFKFTFTLSPIDPSFRNFTDLPDVETSRSDFYLNNLNVSGNELTSKPWIPINYQSFQFKYGFENPGNNIRLKIHNPFDNKILEKQMEKVEDYFSLNLDLFPEEGRYEFIKSIDGIEQDPEFYFLSNWKGFKPFGVIEIFSSELSYTSPIDYDVKFESRSTQWIYNLILKEDYTGNSISITDTRETPEIAFVTENTNYKSGEVVAFKSVELSNNAEAFEIKYSEKPIAGFDLLIEKSGQSDKKIEDLPGPSVRTPIAEMYINI